MLSYSQEGCLPHPHPREAVPGLGTGQGVRADRHVVLVHSKDLGFHKLDLQRDLVFVEHLPASHVTISSNSIPGTGLEDNKSGTPSL